MKFFHFSRLFFSFTKAPPPHVGLQKLSLGVISDSNLKRVGHDNKLEATRPGKAGVRGDGTKRQEGRTALGARSPGRGRESGTSKE
jgi:hypothetical protein